MDPAAANVEDIRTRQLISLDAHLVQLTIGRCLTPKYFWIQIFMHMMKTLTLHASCQNLVNWGSVEVREVQVENITLSNKVLTLYLIGMDASLLNHRIIFVQRDITGLVKVISNPMN